MHIYTLARPFSPEDSVHSILNGKLIIVKKNDDGTMYFVDAVDNNNSVHSTEVVSTVTRTNDLGLEEKVVTTESGTVYPLVDMIQFVMTTATGGSSGIPKKLMATEYGCIGNTNPIITECTIKSPEHWGGMAKVVANMSDGRENVTVFEFFDDEIVFSPAEFIGKTLEEANDLRVQRDKQYLQS
ncbi:MAG: hypothetical protein NC131_10910 [Roseburia sp.]|nr:hypothetical protein [Roseburia sp.]